MLPDGLCRRESKAKVPNTQVRKRTIYYHLDEKYIHFKKFLVFCMWSRLCHYAGTDRFAASSVSLSVCEYVLGS